MRAGRYSVRTWLVWTVATVRAASPLWVRLETRTVPEQNVFRSYRFSFKAALTSYPRLSSMTMTPKLPSTQEKALQINLDAQKYGTFAEIGAGQEVARWFFHVGKASSTVAKSISAYDVAISDDLYGATDHYVSRPRLEAMLDREFGQLSERLKGTRREKDAFFVFADTVATHSSSPSQNGHGWLGVRFQDQAGAEPSEVIIHIEMLDVSTGSQQEAVGIVGV